MPFKNLNDDDLKRSEMVEALDLEEGTFANHFERFKDLYKFQDNDFQEGNRYLFNKEWNGLFYVLMRCLKDHPSFDRRKRTVREYVDAITTFSMNLLAEVDESLPRELRLKIMSHPLYLATTAELMMLESIQYKLADWMNTVGAMPIRVRTMIWSDMNHGIDTWMRGLCVSVAELSRLDELMQADDMLCEDVATTLLGRLDLLVANYLRKEIKTTRNLKAREAFDKWSQENDRPLISELIDKLYDEVASPVLEKEEATPSLEEEEAKRDELLKELVRSASNMASEWRQLDEVLDESLDFVHRSPDDSPNKRHLLESINLVKAAREKQHAHLSEFSITAQQFFNQALSLSTDQTNSSEQ